MSRTLIQSIIRNCFTYCWYPGSQKVGLPGPPKYPTQWSLDTLFRNYWPLESSRAMRHGWRLLCLLALGRCECPGKGEATTSRVGGESNSSLEGMCVNVYTV